MTTSTGLFYTDSGGPGFPIVFLHGFPFDHRMWAPQVAFLKDRFRVITYDHRGFGESKATELPYAFEFFVDDFFAVLEALKIREAIVCGLSMGGYIALRAFERQPTLFKALILSDTKSEADTNEGKIKRSASMKAIYDKGVSAFSETFMKGALAALTWSEQPDVVTLVQSMITPVSPAVLAGAQLAMAARTDTTAVLSTIKIPVLTAVGEEDTLTPPAVVQAMSQRIEGSSFVTIPKAAHLSNLENPTEFNRHLDKFLKPWAKV